MGDALAQSLDHKQGAAFDVRRNLITSAYGAFFVGRFMHVRGSAGLLALANGRQGGRAALGPGAQPQQCRSRRDMQWWSRQAVHCILLNMSLWLMCRSRRAHGVKRLGDWEV